MQEQDVKQRILHVARDMFIREGYNKTSVRAIATASETNVAMVNYYFHSKFNLFEIIFLEAFDILAKRIFTLLDSGKPFPELIEEWVNTYYDTLIEYPQIPLFIINEVEQDPEKLIEFIQQRGPYNIYLKITEILEREAKAGNIRPTPVIDFGLNVLSLCIFPFIFGSLATKIAGRTTEEYKEVLHAHKAYVVQFIIQAMKP